MLMHFKFQKVIDKLNSKPNKICVDKGNKFCNRSFKNSLKDNYTEMYATQNEAKSVVTARFIGTLKSKFYKYMTLI